MITYGNEGPSIKGLSEAMDSSKAEMAAYDQLGPLTRKVLDEEMPVAFSARKTLEVMRMQRVDPKHPQNDRMMAQQLRASIPEIRRKIAVEDAVHKSGNSSQRLVC